MRWTAGLETASIQQITFATDSGMSTLYRILAHGTNHLFSATIISRNPELISNLTVVAVADLNGLAVQCTSDSTGRENISLQVASNEFHACKIKPGPYLTD